MMDVALNLNVNVKSHLMLSPPGSNVIVLAATPVKLELLDLMVDAHATGLQIAKASTPTTDIVNEVRVRIPDTSR